MNPNIKSKRSSILGALFCAAQERGIPAEQLRDEIAPGLINKRLSAASEQEIKLVLTHIAGPMKKRRPSHQSHGSYASSMQGLRAEICDLARARWGDAWSSSLNNLCRKFGVDHYNFLNFAHGKAVKAWFVKNHSSESRVRSSEKLQGWGDQPLPEEPPF